MSILSAIENFVSPFNHNNSIALQTGAFSFIGIEIPAVTALEAKMDVAASDLDQTSNQHVGEWPITTARKALWLSCGRLPILVGPLYLLMGLVASLNVDRANPGLPSQRNEPVDHSYIANCAKSDSIFVISAVASRIPYLGDVFTAFVLLAAWTSANTALYVSSRTLYGLTRHYQNLPMDKNWGPLYTLWWRCRRWPGRTWKTMKGKNIPIPALIVSTILFCWVPFLQVARVASATQVGDEIQHQNPRAVLTHRTDTVYSDGDRISVLRPRMGLRMPRLSSFHVGVRTKFHFCRKHVVDC